MGVDVDPARYAELVRDWYTAADAYRRGDRCTLADGLVPVGDDGTVWTEPYLRMVVLTFIGSVLCGAELARGRGTEDVPVFGFEVVDVSGPARRVVTEAQDAESARQLALGRFLCAAANEQFDTLSGLIFAYMPVEAGSRPAGVLMDLLGIYVELADGTGRDRP